MGCTAETREKIIRFERLGRKKGGAKVYWMNGMAGLEDDDRYSCANGWRKRETRWQLLLFRAGTLMRDANKLSTLAFQLSQSSPAYRSALQSLKKGAAGKQTRGAMAVSEAHRGPHPRVKEVGLEDTVIVIDALESVTTARHSGCFWRPPEARSDLPFRLPYQSTGTCNPTKNVGTGRSRSVPLHDIEESSWKRTSSTLADRVSRYVPRPSSYQVNNLQSRWRLFI
ncbi:hypothetical protein APHAL10511_003485 [Amanita phalloides]|nr:hypothetical protein APHAL10511_003485 [Amanita phalloides]